MSSYYTLEQLTRLTGYGARRIYDLTHLGIVSPPIRGLDPNLYGSKGSYPAEVLEQLKRYKALKIKGFKRSDIASIMKREAENVQVLKG